VGEVVGLKQIKSSHASMVRYPETRSA
jgi:hypothetical protein